MDVLLSKLRWDTPQEELNKAITILREVDDLSILVKPIDKAHWDNAAMILRDIGYPRIHNILPNLLEWTQDLNWPGSRIIAELLASIGEPLIPFIKVVFKAQDHIWNYWILSYILDKWQSDLVQQLEFEILEIACNFDNEDAHIEALKLLVTKEIGNCKDLLALVRSKRKYHKNLDKSTIDKLNIFEEILEKSLK